MKSSLPLAIVIMLIFSCSKSKNDSFAVPEDYRTWSKPVKKILDYPISGHEKTYRIIYGNDIAFTAEITMDNSGNKRIIMPHGSVIIKEIYKRKGDVNRKEPVLTIMVKDEKNIMSADGWLYYMKKPGKDVAHIKSKMCIGCHEAANDRHPYFDENKKRIFRDYLFAKFAK